MELLRTAVLCVMALASTTAWAGRGDIDPNYGDGGRVSAVAGAMLALPGGRLVIADASTEEGLRVRMLDATGRSVPEFGADGVARFDPLSVTWSFVPEAAARAPNGDLIFTGWGSKTPARELLRLDQDGQPVASFGIGGGILTQLPVASARALAFAVDPDGRILLAEGTWHPDESCEYTARLQRLLANGQPDTEFGNDSLSQIPDFDICNGAPVFGARADGSVLLGDGYAIVAVDATGAIDPAFGVDGRLTFPELSWARALLLPDGGLLVFGSRGEPVSANDSLFMKFDRNGQADTGFGDGTGSVTIDLGGVLLGDPSLREFVNHLALDPADGHLVAQVRFLRANDDLACDGIARLSIDGVPDTGFGRDGLTCLNVNPNLIAVQGDGAPLFVAGSESDSIHRLLPDDSPSPGFLRFVTMSLGVGESQGTAAVAIERIAGRDGAVSADFATIPRRVHYYCGYHDCQTDPATADRDYATASGRLDWASGDAGQRTISVSILDDDVHENRETLGIVLSEPGGAVQFITDIPTIVINDDDDAPATTPPPPPPPPPSGGGGSATWASLLTLLTLLLIRRRGGWRLRLQPNSGRAS